jgi:TatD DNase family protein
MNLIDTHAHLEDFESMASLVERAKDAGLIGIIAMSANLKTCKRAYELSKDFSGYVYAAIGVHPQEAWRDLNPAFKFVEQHIDDCVGIGEIGLDWWIKVDRNAQISVFTRLLKLAKEYNLPVSLHSRGAWDDCYRILQKYEIRSAVFHWYSGSIETLKNILESGYLVSATPATEYSKAHRQAIKTVPLDMLMLETDCPVRYRDKESEPSDVVRTLHFVAKLMSIPPQIVASKTTENAIKFFRLNK